MKKLLIIIISVTVLALLFVFVLHSRKPSIPVDGKFGFTRDVTNMRLEKIEDTGATWFRPNFGYFVWGVMQKNQNSPIDFSKTDKIVSDAQKQGLRLSVTVFPFADWDQISKGVKCKVSENDTGLPQSKGDFITAGLPYYRCNPSSWNLYEKWLVAVVERYDDDGVDDMEGLEYPILHYEIGNEPDLMKDPVSGIGTVYFIGTPENYAELLQKSYIAIKAANSSVQVLIAAPAGVQPEFIKFWKGVFATPKISDYFDIGNMHCISPPSQDANDPSAISAGDLNVTVYKNLLLSYGITKPIWVTEADNVQVTNVAENVKRLKSSVTNALKNGAEKIFFTGASFANEQPFGLTSEILISEKSYYKDIILTAK